jgi:NADH-quinone oxidoreductase subunit J
MISLVLILLVLLSAIAVVLLQNPVQSVLALVLTFFNTAILLFSLGIEFVSYVFVIVYLGAIAVLFLFVVMMLNIINTTSPKGFSWYGVLSLVSFGVCFILLLTGVTRFVENLIVADDISPFLGTSETILFETQWVDLFYGVEDIVAIGRVLYTSYFYSFFGAAFVLLVAMIGAIVLTVDCRYQQLLSLRKKQDIAIQVQRGNKIFYRNK